jgi:dihydroxy-acid dehydratase
MPEAGLIPIPKKLAVKGVKDMVRISDGRMSGTASGTVVLHVSPESAVGGPLAIVQDGDMISLDVIQRSITLEIAQNTLRERLAAWKVENESKIQFERGYRGLYKGSVGQAHEGADFGFLRALGAFHGRV